MLGRIRPSVLDEMNGNQVSKSMVASKATDAFVKKVLQNDELLTPILPFVQKRKIEAFGDQCKVAKLAWTSTGAVVNKYKVVAANTNLVQEASIRASSECTGEESYESRESWRARHCNWNWNRQEIVNYLIKLDSTVSVSGIDSEWKVRRNCAVPVECLIFPSPNP